MSSSPRTDLLTQRNPTCDANGQSVLWSNNNSLISRVDSLSGYAMTDTTLEHRYSGGLGTCHHDWFLLDSIRRSLGRINRWSTTRNFESTTKVNESYTSRLWDRLGHLQTVITQNMTWYSVILELPWVNVYVCSSVWRSRILPLNGYFNHFTPCFNYVTSNQEYLNPLQIKCKLIVSNTPPTWHKITGTWKPLPSTHDMYLVAVYVSRTHVSQNGNVWQQYRSIALFSESFVWWKAPTDLSSWRPWYTVTLYLRLTSSRFPASPLVEHDHSHCRLHELDNGHHGDGTSSALSPPDNYALYGLLSVWVFFFFVCFCVFLLY